MPGWFLLVCTMVWMVHHGVQCRGVGSGGGKQCEPLHHRSPLSHSRLADSTYLIASPPLLLWWCSQFSCGLVTTSCGR